MAINDIGFYESIILIDIISDRKKDDIMIMSIATQSDPKELKKNLYGDDYIETETLDKVGLENLKRKLAGSHFGVKG